MKSKILFMALLSVLLTSCSNTENKEQNNTDTKITTNPFDTTVTTTVSGDNNAVTARTLGNSQHRAKIVRILNTVQNYDKRRLVLAPCKRENVLNLTVLKVGNFGNKAVW